MSSLTTTRQFEIRAKNGKSKKAGREVTVFWSVRANSVRRLSRAEAEVPGRRPARKLVPSPLTRPTDSGA